MINSKYIIKKSTLYSHFRFAIVLLKSLSDLIIQFIPETTSERGSVWRLWGSLGFPETAPKRGWWTVWTGCDWSNILPR